MSDLSYLYVPAVVMIGLWAIMWFVFRDSKQERRITKLRLTIKEIELRNELLKLEGREDEIKHL